MRPLQHQPSSPAASHAANILVCLGHWRSCPPVSGANPRRIFARGGPSTYPDMLSAGFGRTVHGSTRPACLRFTPGAPRSLAIPVRVSVVVETDDTVRNLQRMNRGGN